jgi:hypothetical protein
VTAGAGVARLRAIGATARQAVVLVRPFVVHTRASRIVFTLILETIVTLTRHLLAGSTDDVARVGVSWDFHITVLALLIWVLICHELNLSVETD